MKKILILMISIALIFMVACKKDNISENSDLENEMLVVDFPQDVTLPGDLTEEIIDESIEEPIKEEIEEPVVVGVDLTNETVLWLQESLKIVGYYTALDGDFGLSTKAQLKSFQTDHGLQAGVYDEATKNLLIEKLKGKQAPGIGTYMILLNKKYHLPSRYVPEQLREVEALKTKNIQLPDEVASAAESMIAAAEKEGLNIYLVSGYRSYAYQENIFSRRVDSHGFESAEKIIAIPGQSEHQTGLAIDVSTEAVDFGLWNVFDETPEFEWLMAHCHEYGFILRYLKDQTQVTGYVYEPWHYRYVQDPEVAKKIMDAEITLEAYLGN